MKKKNGFSLIELLIVVAIILIIAAIAIPNLLKSRMAANESSAVGSVRTLNTAQVTYQNGCPATGFANGIAVLNTGGGCAAGIGIIDNVLSTGTKSGYTFAVVSPGSTGGAIGTTYDTNAAPVTRRSRRASRRSTRLSPHETTAGAPPAPPNRPSTAP